MAAISCAVHNDRALGQPPVGLVLGIDGAVELVEARKFYDALPDVVLVSRSHSSTIPGSWCDNSADGAGTQSFWSSGLMACKIVDPKAQEPAAQAPARRLPSGAEQIDDRRRSRSAHKRPARRAA
jgi:hypothetical protein